MRLLAVAVLACAASARADTVRTPNCKTAKTSAKIRTLRDVDWCNYRFGGFRGSLKDGHGETHLYRKLGEAHDTISATLRGVVYGNFDGDKQVEAAVVLERTTWIAATSSSYGDTTIYIYKLANGAPEMVGSIEAAGVTAITIARKVVTVTTAEGKTKVTRRYALTSDDFEVIK